MCWNTCLRLHNISRIDVRVELNSTAWLVACFQSVEYGIELIVISVGHKEVPTLL